MGARPADDLDPRVADLIRHKVKQIAGSYGFTNADKDDLRQELTLHVIAGMRHHDPSRASPRTFADRIITSKLATIIEHATAGKRDRRTERALDAAAESVRLEEDPSRQQFDLAMDVRQAIDDLPEDLRQVARLLCEYTAAQVSRRSGYSRQQVRRMRQELQRHFRAMGMAPDS